MAKHLYPTANITNAITQLNEIGRGSAPASVGEYFSTHAPFLGETSLTRLTGFNSLEGTLVPARKNDGDGSVVDAAALVDAFAKESIRNGKYPILHGVFGGKTGLRDAVMPATTTDESMGVVDACQGRFTTDEMRSWMARESVVLFTGSKFYQAPPFCGAIIVPPGMAARLSEESLSRDAEDMLGREGLGAFVTDKELPSCLSAWNDRLRNDDANNVGLALRWEAGLAGMEALASVPEEARAQAVSDWANAVTAMVNDTTITDGLLDAWCVERSIISIRLTKTTAADATDDGQERWLNVDELRMVYRWMSADVSSAVSSSENNLSTEERKALSTPAYIGQPVDVSASHGIVRIALGVESLLSYLEVGDKTLLEDRLVVTKLALLAKYFDELKESGL
jgi:hypothetical protein